MKVFILVLISIFVSALGEELTFDRNSNSDLPQRSAIAPIPLLRQQLNQNERLSARFPGNSLQNQDSKEWVPLRHSNGGVSQDVDELNPDMLTALLRNGPNTQTTNSNVATDSSLGYWAAYPNAAAFDAKIKARLESSRVLGDKPEIRKKLTELAENKFNMCKDLNDDREKACLGRCTGQIMQLIAAVENMHRNSQ